MSNEFTNPVCPTYAELVAFSAGHLIDGQLVAIAEHTATCRHCETLLETIGPADSPLVAAVAGARKWDALLDTQGLRDLLARGQQMPVPSDAFLFAEEDPEADDGGHRAVDTSNPLVKSQTETWKEHPPAALPVSVEDRDEPLPEKIGQYFVLKRLGGGGFGDVYLAKDPEQNRLVAIKVPRQGKLIEEEQIKDFLQEARTVAALNHPNIVPVYDWGRTQADGCFVVMKYIEGQSLEAAHRSQALDHNRVAEICAQIAEALHYAHGRLTHRDIKPANILLDKDGRPHIVDFGLAIHDESQRQYKGQRAGTRPYMAPEQIRGESHHLDGRCDVWALGVTLYELLTRRRPFVGQDVQLRDEILNRLPKPLRQVDDSIPRALETICLRCLAKSATDRYATALDLAQDLRSWISTTTAHVEPVRPRPMLWQRTLLVVAPLLLLVITIPAVMYTSGWNTRPPFLEKGLQPNDTFPLLKFEPQVLCYPHSRDLPPVYAAKQQQLSVDCGNLAILDLGQTRSQNFDVKVDLSKSVWRGDAGFYFGWDRHKLANGGKCICPFVLVRCVADDDIRIEIGSLTIAETDQGISVNHVAVHAQSVTKNPGLRGATLEVSVRNGRLDSVFWSSDPVPQNVLDLVPPTANFSNGIGFVNRNGSTSFREARFLLVK